MGRSLKLLLKALTSCAPAERIGLRDEILGHGVDCIEPLVALVEDQPDLASSVASWLEVLVNRDLKARQAVLTALRRLAAGPEGGIARQSLDRLTEAARPARSPHPDRARGKGRVRRDSGAEVYSRLIAAAKEGRLLTYTELETSRGHVGKYLRRIVQEEADAGHPPLTAIVVTKTTGRPGDGFLPAMLEIGSARPGESAEDVWRRAVAAVFDFWRDKP